MNTVKYTLKKFLKNSYRLSIENGYSSEKLFKIFINNIFYKVVYLDKKEKISIDIKFEIISIRIEDVS